MEHRPEYLRMSQAERERAQREKEATLLIRELKEEDAAAVCEMERQLFTDCWSEKGILETIRHQSTICLAAEKAGSLIGYLLVYFAAGEAGDRENRGRERAAEARAARQMMKELERICKSRRIGAYAGCQGRKREGAGIL